MGILGSLHSGLKYKENQWSRLHARTLAVKKQKNDGKSVCFLALGFPPKWVKAIYVERKKERKKEVSEYSWD